MGDKINIPLDMVIENAEYKIVTVTDEPYEGAEVGDPYLDFTVANAAQSHLYVPLKDLVDVYTGGTHITVTNNVINHDSQGSDASTPMGQDIPSPGQGQTGTINVSGQVAYDSLGHVISVTVKNIYSSVKTVADASAAAVGADKVDKINSPTGDMIAKSTSTGNVAETSISVSALTGALSDISDLQSDKMDKIANATGDKIATTTASGEVAESGTAIADLATQTDLADKMDKIDSASGDKVLVSNFNGEAVESDIDVSNLITGSLATTGYLVLSSGNHEVTTEGSVTISDLATASDLSNLQSDVNNIASDLGNLETLVGTIPAGSSATTVVDYAQEVADAAAGDAVGDLDLAQVGGAGYYLTAVSQTDGQVAASATLADTAVTNASSNLVTSGAVYTAVANATPTWTVVE